MSIIISHTYHNILRSSCSYRRSEIIRDKQIKSQKKPKIKNQKNSFFYVFKKFRKKICGFQFQKKSVSYTKLGTRKNKRLRSRKLVPKQLYLKSLPPAKLARKGFQFKSRTKRKLKKGRYKHISRISTKYTFDTC